MIVVFDGMCNVCTFYIRFLARHDHGKRLAFVPAASPLGRQWLTTCGESPDAPTTMIVVEHGVPRLRSDALLAALAALGGGWRAVRVLALVPRGLRDALYTGFARRRYRWFGRVDACPACDAGARPEQ